MFLATNQFVWAVANESALYVQFESRSVDAEYVYLMHDLQSTEIPGHIYRGYTLLTQDGRKLRSIQVSKPPHMHVLADMELYFTVCEKGRYSK
jgi:hypothetical protein